MLQLRPKDALDRADHGCVAGGADRRRGAPVGSVRDGDGRVAGVPGRVGRCWLAARGAIRAFGARRAAADHLDAGLRHRRGPGGGRLRGTRCGTSRPLRGPCADLGHRRRPRALLCQVRSPRAWVLRSNRRLAHPARRQLLGFKTRWRPEPVRRCSWGSWTIC